MNSTRQKKSGQNVKMTNLNGVIRSNESEDNFKNMSTEEQLLSNNKKNKKKTRIQNKSECVGTNDCTHCLDEREINLVYLAENQLLWSELRGHVLYMYKIGRDQNLGPTIVDRVKYLVDALCSKDIHQLFIRLELLAKEVVKDCLESVERIFLNEIRNTTIAYNYLENIITDCDNYLFAARKMLPMLKNLETHLKKFNICWILLHQNLFRIHYLEDRRCQIRAKKAKLLLLSDMEIPAFTETILKFSQFNEAFGALSKQWDESMMKIQKFRESKQVYKNCQHLLNDTWQNFNVNKKSNKFLQDNRNSQDFISNKKMNFDTKINNKTFQLNQNSNIYENNTTLTKSQAKKARRRMKGDHSRQPSADLMPPPAPPRVTDTDCQNHQNCASTQTNLAEYLDPGEFMPKTIGGDPSAKERAKKRQLPPPPASPTPPTSPLKKFAPSMSVDNRDVDALVAFVEGLNINEKNIDIIECENKRRRKKQKKEKQRLKKMQSLLEEDQVAQLIKRSPGVTITMVRSNGNNSQPNNNTRNIPQPKPQMATIQPQQPQQSLRNIPTTPIVNNNTKNETKDPVLKNTSTTNGTGNVVVENSGSRMVTIRRITEANTDEPTVTITLKGPTPDQDQVLYRIINGQANYGHLAENVLNKKNVNNSNNNNNIEKTEPSITPLVQLTKKQKKKMKRNNELSIESVPPVGQNFNYNSETKHENDIIHVTKSKVIEANSCNEKKNSKKSKKSSNTELNCNELNTKSNNLAKNKKKNGPIIENTVSSCDNTNSTKTSKPVKQQNSKQKQKTVDINTVSPKQSTKTKSDVPPKSTPANKTSINTESNKKASKPTSSNAPQKQNSKVSRPATTTNSIPNTKQKPEPKLNSKHVESKQPITNKRMSQSTSNTPRNAVNSNQIREQKNERVYTSNSNVQHQQQQQQHHHIQKSTPTTTHQINGTDIYHDTNSNNYKLIPENLRLPAGITITKVPPNCNTRKMTYDTQRKFNSNHLDITPETSRVHFAGTEPQQQQQQRPPRNDLSVDLIIEKQQQLESDFEIRPENRQPPIGTGVPRACDAPAKFIRAPDGRIIIRSPMARSTTPPLNPITMIRQDLEMGVSPPNVPIPSFWSRNDWWLPG